MTQQDGAALPRNVLTQRGGSLREVDDGRVGYVQSVYASDVGLEVQQLAPLDPPEALQPVGDSSSLEGVKPRTFVLGDGHDDFADAPQGHGVLRREHLHISFSVATEERPPGAWPVVDA